MKRRFIIYLLLFLAACQGTDDSLEPSKLRFASPLDLTKGRVIRGSYLVAFKSPDERLWRRDYQKEYQSHYLRLAHLASFESGVKDLHYITALDLAHSKRPVSPLPGPAALQNWQQVAIPPKPASLMRVDFSSEAEARRLLNQWFQDGKIYYAEPNDQSSKLFDNPFQTLKATYKKIAATNQALWLNQLGVFEALDALSSRSDIDFANAPIVAVLDSGLDFLHPSFQNQVLVNSGDFGCEGDLYGCNTTQSFKGSLGTGDIFPVGTADGGEPCPTEVADICVHGTHVAGIVAAAPENNSSGSFGGVCPVCRLLAVKIVGVNKIGEGGATSIADSSILSGLTYVSRFLDSSTPVRLINASFGKNLRSVSVEHLVRLLAESGVLVIAAAGNEDSMERQYPAAYNDALAVVNVSSIADNAAKAPSSNFGLWTDIAAPGSGGCDADEGEGGIISTFPGGDTGCLGGTSMSSPMVAGVAGLLLLSDPGLSISDLRQRLLVTSDPSLYDVKANFAFIPSIAGEPNPIPLLGSGVVSATNAVSNVVKPNRPRPAFSRVTGGCGAIPALGSFPLLLLLAPLCLKKRRKSRSKGGV